MTYVDDDAADEFGSRVFLTEAEAMAAADAHTEDQGVDEVTKYATYEPHTITVPFPGLNDVTVTTTNGEEVEVQSQRQDGADLSITVWS
ncbi:hypothetical protein [Mycolicibacterium frederiksbergense]|uniref:Halobacterial output domain-containing protein n=1 Tax=Mycolicibacterium frederiksbergense TaxID=117567 RepID=A0A6H0S0P2_9MYCO|nr:hypothetical protein [Mycolicibacterium frederiksbergense]QIV79885.1 hypothetical protein EXE63_02450 [Mycolicibacterium frederiksbergense]